MLDSLPLLHPSPPIQAAKVRPTLRAQRRKHDWCTHEPGADNLICVDCAEDHRLMFGAAAVRGATRAGGVAKDAAAEENRRQEKPVGLQKTSAYP